MLLVRVRDRTVGRKRVVIGEMRVPDEDERCVRRLEGLRRRLLVEDIREVVDGRSVHQQIFVRSQFVRKGVEPRDVILVDDAARPLDRRARGVVEILDTESVDRGDVVIAEDRRLHAFAHECQTFVRIRAVADDVAEAEDRIACRDAREHRFERLHVRVDVGEHRVSHSASAFSNASANSMRSRSVPTVTRM